MIIVDNGRQITAKKLEATAATAAVAMSCQTWAHKPIVVYNERMAWTQKQRRQQQQQRKGSDDSMSDRLRFLKGWQLYRRLSGMSLAAPRALDVTH